MLYPKHRKARRGPLKNLLAMAFGACLLGIASLGAGVCQTPGYGDKPDQWAPYQSGQYFEQLQKILSIHAVADSRIFYLHFEVTDVGVGPVELFRVSEPRSAECSDRDCYLFVLIASDHSNTPLVTPCQFRFALLSHVFNPDGSRAFGFEFSCTHTSLQVRVTPTDLMAISVEKTK